jgi:hypothetical protein
MEIDKIEDAFQETTKVVLGRKLTKLSDYRTWLLRYVGGAVNVRSEVSNNPVYVPNIIFYTSIKRNLVTLEEAEELGKRHVPHEVINALTLANAHQKLKEILYVTSDVKEGENSDVRESGTYMNAHHCLNGVFYIYSKYDAYCFWPRETEYSFGCHYLFASKFCIQCHNSVALTRCFEVSDSNKCSDCYFCHNCENLNDCMFCFNVKSKRYAIGNIEVGREKYMKIRKLLLEEIGQRLEKEKNLDLSIYSFGCRE